MTLKIFLPKSVRFIVQIFSYTTFLHFFFRDPMAKKFSFHMLNECCDVDIISFESSNSKRLFQST